MIGNDALKAADEVFGFDSDEERELITAVLEAAGPLIVAAELERLADEIDGRDYRQSLGARRLRSRAAELKGGRDA